MADENTDPSGLTADADTTSDVKIASYDIAPEDQSIADEIRAMEPATLPSNNSATAGMKMPAALTAAALPPHLRGAVEDRLTYTPPQERAAAEHAAVLEVLRANALELRSKSGFAPEVPAYWHERSNLIREYNSALGEWDRLNAEMQESIRYDRGEDGKPVGVIALSETRQRGIAARQSELLYRASLLFDEDGTPAYEGRRRLDKALSESVATIKAQRTQREDHAAASKLADEMNRDERVRTLAEALAKHRRSN